MRCRLRKRKFDMGIWGFGCFAMQVEEEVKGVMEAEEDVVQVEETEI